VRHRPDGTFAQGKVPAGAQAQSAHAAVIASRAAVSEQDAIPVAQQHPSLSLVSQLAALPVDMQATALDMAGVVDGGLVIAGPAQNARVAGNGGKAQERMTEGSSPGGGITRRQAPPPRPFPPELLAHPGDKDIQIDLRHLSHPPPPPPPAAPVFFAVAAGFDSILGPVCPPDTDHTYACLAHADAGTLWTLFCSMYCHMVNDIGTTHTVSLDPWYSIVLTLPIVLTLLYLMVANIIKHSVLLGGALLLACRNSPCNLCIISTARHSLGSRQPAPGLILRIPLSRATEREREGGRETETEGERARLYLCMYICVCISMHMWRG